MALRDLPLRRDVDGLDQILKNLLEVGLTVTGEAQPRIRLDRANTKLEFGPGGSTAPDVWFQRTAANQLRLATSEDAGNTSRFTLTGNANSFTWQASSNTVTAGYSVYGTGFNYAEAGTISNHPYLIYANSAMSTSGSFIVDNASNSFLPNNPTTPRLGSGSKRFNGIFVDILNPDFAVTNTAGSLLVGLGSTATQGIELGDNTVAATTLPYLDFRRANGGAIAHVQSVTCDAASTLASSGSASYFMAYTPSTSYYVWFNKTDAGTETDPAIGGATSIQVDILDADTAQDVSDKLVSKINTSFSGAFTAANGSGTSTTVTITNVVAGTTEFFMVGTLPNNTAWAVTLVTEGENDTDGKDLDVRFINDAQYRIRIENSLGTIYAYFNRNQIRFTRPFVAENGIILEGGTFTIPFLTASGGLVDTNFKINAQYDYLGQDVRIYSSNGTTPVSNLSAGVTQGSFCLNGPSGGAFIYNGSAWVQLATGGLSYSPTGSRIPYGDGAGDLTDEASFSYNATNDVLTAGRLSLSGGTTTIPQIALASGTFLTVPVDGTLEYNSTSGLSFTQSSSRFKILMAAALGTNEIPFINSTVNGTLQGSSNLTYNSGASTLIVPNLTGLGSLTLGAAVSPTNTVYITASNMAVNGLVSAYKIDHTNTVPTNADLVGTGSVSLIVNNTTGSSSYSGQVFKAGSSPQAQFGQYLERSGSYTGTLKWRMLDSATTSHEIFAYEGANKDWIWTDDIRQKNAVVVPKTEPVTAAAGTSTISKNTSVVRITGNNTQTINLPDAATTTDQIIEVYRGDAFTTTLTINVVASGGSILNGGTSITTAYGGFRYQSNGTNYITLP